MAVRRMFVICLLETREKVKTSATAFDLKIKVDSSNQKKNRGHKRRAGGIFDISFFMYKEKNGIPHFFP